MNRLNARHLTTEQLYALLDHSTDTATRSHLQGCVPCQSELESMRASLAGFRLATTNFAAAQAPRFAPRPHVSAKSGPAFNLKAWAASLATAAALLTLSISLFHAPQQIVPADSSSPAYDHAAMVNTTPESDEALLDGIERDLSTSIPPSLAPLAVPAAAGTTSTHN